MANDPVEYRDVNLENIDLAIKDWFVKTVDARVKDQTGELRTVPVVFSSGERWVTGRTKQTFRDKNGVLILPIISVRRVSIDPDMSKMALGVQTPNIQIAKRVDSRSSEIKNLQTLSGTPTGSPPVYDVYTIPFPDRMQATYQLVIQTQLITQANEILQKIWHSLDIQKSFVAPLENNGRQPPRSKQFGGVYDPVEPLTSRYVVGFLDGVANDAGNFEEFTDNERIIKYTTDIRVPFVLLTSPEGAPSPVKVTRTAYKVVVKDEVVTRGTSMKQLDDIFNK